MRSFHKLVDFDFEFDIDIEIHKATSIIVYSIVYKETNFMVQKLLISIISDELLDKIELTKTES